MTDPDAHAQGFSRGRRWLTTLNLLAATAALLAVLVMVNYVAQGHFVRYQLANYTNFKLSPQTLRVLRSLTNDVKVTVFYERDTDDVYLMIRDLLAQYENASKHIQIAYLDPSTSPGDASLFLERLHLGKQKDFVAFESNGHVKICKGSELSNYNIDKILSGQSQEIERTAFLGEAVFTDLIFAVSYPRPMKAYFLTGHGERDPGDPTQKAKSDEYGVSKLAAMLKDEIDCNWDTLLLTGTNPVPSDCDLLIIATPREDQAKLASNELAQIQTYLKKNNGRLLALLDTTEGLDPILADPWGAQIGPTPVMDFDVKARTGTYDFVEYVAWATNLPLHPIVKPLATEHLRVRMVLPRPVLGLSSGLPAPGAPTMSPLIATTNGMEVAPSTNGPVPLRAKAGSCPLVVAIEQGVITGGDGTRIVLAGDADFLDDQLIDSVANHLFARQALNWLLHRNEIALEGLPPLRIKEYRLTLTEAQNRQMEWVFLCLMPGSVLLLGGLVWLRRRS